MPALAVCAYISLFILGLIDNIRGPFYPEVLAAFGVSSAQGSLFFALVSLFAFAGAFLSHKWIQNRSSLYLLIGASVLFSAGFIAVALAPSWITLCVACAVFGLGFGGLNLSQNTLVLESAPPYMRRRMLNGLHGMYALASVLAPFTASMFRALDLNWRMAFLILGLLPWLLLAGIGQFVKRPSHDKTSEIVIPLYSNEWKQVWFYALLAAAYLWGEISITTRMVLWLRTDMGFGPDAANFVLGAFFAMFMGGRLLFSVVHFPNWTNWDVMIRSSFLTTLLMAAGLAWHPLFLVLSGFAMAPFYPVVMDQINSHFGEKSAQALGFIIGFGSLSVVVMHLTVGLVTDVWSLTQSLYLCTAAMGLVFVTLLLRSRFDRAR